MNDIRLVKPVVLRSTLSDMCPVHREQAERLLCGADIINGDEIVSRKELNKDSIFGSEAVILLRESLGLPDVSIRTVPVNSIYAAVVDYGVLADINFFLSRVKSSCRRIERLMELDAPPVIMINEYRMLQERMEDLLENGWGGKPVTAGTDERISLKELGFSVRMGICRG